MGYFRYFHAARFHVEASGPKFQTPIRSHTSQTLRVPMARAAGGIAAIDRLTAYSMGYGS